MTWKQTAPTTQWNENRAAWMSQLDDDIKIQDLSIPGTHDSAALKGWVRVATIHSAISETQNWRIDEQLQNGIRFLDLRVKIKFQHKGLAMYHGVAAIYDSEDHGPNNLNQLDYQTVISKCADFLKQNPKETIIISLKSEGDTTYEGLSIEDWFRTVANNVAWEHSTTWDKMWDCRSNVDATLGDVRGKMLLWRRFPREGQASTINYSTPFGLDLTPMNAQYDNTAGASWYTENGGYSYVQDHYSSLDYLGEKVGEWLKVQRLAFDSRWDSQNTDWNRQYINFSSVGDGGKPIDYADIINPLLGNWLDAVINKDGQAQQWGAPQVRSGLGVIPMDFPAQCNIDSLIRMNFSYSYPILATEQGKGLAADLVLRAGAPPDQIAGLIWALVGGAS